MGGVGDGQFERTVPIGPGRCCLVEGPDRADVLPVAVEQMDLHVPAPDRGRKDLPAEVLVVGLVEHVDQRLRSNR